VCSVISILIQIYQNAFLRKENSDQFKRPFKQTAGNKRHALDLEDEISPKTLKYAPNTCLINKLNCELSLWLSIFQTV